MNLERQKNTRLKQGYQYANSNFNSWADDYALEGTYWDNGNNDFGEITEKYTNNETVGVKMESKIRLYCDQICKR